MNINNVEWFVLSAIALLGSPGPAIACILAVGRAESTGRAFRYLAGVLLGLSVAAAASAAGLFSILALIPGSIIVMNIIASIYLAYIAYKIATSPVGSIRKEGDIPSSIWSGVILGLSNPKGYVAFVTLFSSFILVADNTQADSMLKWVLTVMVMIFVDTLWLIAGIALKHSNFNDKIERRLNAVLGMMIFGSIVFIHI